MITDNYIKMCEQAPRELWDNQSKNSRIGTLMVWRFFRGIIVPCEKRGEAKGLLAFIPEALVVRTWLKNDEDITVLEINQDYPGLNGDKGTPLYTQEQLQEMLNSERCMNDLRFEYKIEVLLYHLSEFISIKNGRYNLSKSNDSFEQLWLAFVMHEKYHKIWTGEKWEEEKPK